MSNELEIAKKTELLSSLPANTMAQVGDNNMQIASVGTMNNIANYVLPPVKANNGTTVSAVAICRDYYNLFVVENEAFTEIVGHFTVPKDLALTESMTEELKTQFSTLQGDAIPRIKTFPSIFASTNRGFGKTDADHMAYYGIELDVERQGNGIKINYYKLSPVPQQKLNEMVATIGLEYASSFNELDKTHWAIKQIDLIEELRRAGISVLAPT